MTDILRNDKQDELLDRLARLIGSPIPRPACRICGRPAGLFEDDHGALCAECAVPALQRAPSAS